MRTLLVKRWSKFTAILPDVPIFLQGHHCNGYRMHCETINGGIYAQTLIKPPSSVPNNGIWGKMAMVQSKRKQINYNFLKHSRIGEC